MYLYLKENKLLAVAILKFILMHTELEYVN